MTSAFGGQRSIQLSYGCLEPARHIAEGRASAQCPDCQQRRRAPSLRPFTAAGARWHIVADMSQTPQLKPGDHLYLIDGSGYIFRAYHALPPLSRKSDGLPVQAVQGFCAMLWKLMREMKSAKPTHLAVIFDKSEKSFRNDILRPVQGAPAGAAGRSETAIRDDPPGDAGLQCRLRRAGQLRGRRPDRHLCARSRRSGRDGAGSFPPTRTSCSWCGPASRSSTR